MRPRTATIATATATWRHRLASKGISRGPRRCHDGCCSFRGGDVSVHRRRGFDPSVGGGRGGMRVALAAHDEVLRAAIEAHGGFLFKHTGDGVCAAFASPRSAVDAAVTAQRELELPVRMGLATGEAELREGDYFGAVLNRAARVMDAGHGGQVLLDDTTAGLLQRHRPDCSWGHGGCGTCQTGRDVPSPGRRACVVSFRPCEDARCDTGKPAPGRPRA